MPYDGRTRAFGQEVRVAVAVFGQLGHILRERNLSLADLKRQIEERYGLPVDLTVLERLSSPEAIDRTDMRVAAAAAMTLGLSLDDLFSVQDALNGPRGSKESFLSKAEARRVHELFDLRDARGLTSEEERELRSLVDEEGRRFGDYHLARYASRRGISIEEAQYEADKGIAEAIALNARLDADPSNREKHVEDAKRRQATSR
jgi:hypothetical protein